MPPPQHPGATAVAKIAEFVAVRTRIAELTARAAQLRREAKAARFSADAYKLRLDAKAASDSASQLRVQAKALKFQACEAIHAAAKAYSGRLPDSYTDWGVVKTRAYVKVLGVLVAQGRRTAPNLVLASSAISLLDAHTEWSDQVLAGLASIKTLPKTLPSPR